MQGASVTAQSFVPRHVVEPTQELPLPVNPSATRPREEAARRPSGSPAAPYPAPHAASAASRQAYLRLPLPDLQEDV